MNPFQVFYLGLGHKIEKTTTKKKQKTNCKLIISITCKKSDLKDLVSFMHNFHLCQCSMIASVLFIDFQGGVS